PALHGPRRGEPPSNPIRGAGRGRPRGPGPGPTHHQGVDAQASRRAPPRLTCTAPHDTTSALDRRPLRSTAGERAPGIDWGIMETATETYPGGGSRKVARSKVTSGFRVSSPPHFAGLVAVLIPKQMKNPSGSDNPKGLSLVGREGLEPPTSTM